MKVEIASFDNTFIEYLCSFVFFDSARLTEMMNRYVIGATAQREPVFWHINAERRVTNGHIITMDGETGKVYDESWYRQDGRPMCLFGEHLLKDFPDKPVALVKDEMTAAIMSCFPTPYVWLATGTVRIVATDLLSLKGKTVVIFPDKGEYEHWQEIASTVSDVQFHASDVMENTQGDFHNISQIILSRQPLRPTEEETVLMRLEDANPNIRKLIEVLGLEVMSVSFDDSETTGDEIKTGTISKVSTQASPHDASGDVRIEQEKRWHGRNPECHMCPFSHEGINGTYCDKLNHYVEHGKGDCGISP